MDINLLHRLCNYSIITKGAGHRPPFTITADLKFVGMSFFLSVCQSSRYECTNICMSKNCDFVDWNSLMMEIMAIRI